MKKEELSESLSQDSNKVDGINKYGKKKKDKKSLWKSVLFYISIITFSFVFFFVVIWGYYLLSEKNKKIVDLEKENCILESKILYLRDKLKDQCLKNQELKEDLDSLTNDFAKKEKELKETLDEKMQIETEKKFLNNQNEKLVYTIYKFLDLNENAMEAYKNLTDKIANIDRKCEVNINNDNSVSNSNNDNSIHIEKKFCLIF